MTSRFIGVNVGDGAIMKVPSRAWLWRLRYQFPASDRNAVAEERMLAAEVMESYLYLVNECSKEEAWRRIKLLREAMKDAAVTDD